MLMGPVETFRDLRLQAWTISTEIRPCFCVRQHNAKIQRKLGLCKCSSCSLDARKIASSNVNQELQELQCLRQVCCISHTQKLS